MTRQILKRAALLLVTAAVAASCASSPTGRSQLVFMSEAELEREGRARFEAIRETQALVTDRATIDYVACVTNAVVNQLEGDAKDMYWELAIVDNPAVNAQVLPGGKIVVYSGILAVAENQDQLAAVIGHEIAHVTARHPNERMSRIAATNAVADTATLVLGGGYARQTAAASSAVNPISTYLVMFPHTRTQETEADIVGLEYMARAGFDPRESVELWKAMEAKNASSVPEYMSTHPSSETRINDLIEHYPTALVYYNQAQQEGLYPDCKR